MIVSRAQQQKKLENREGRDAHQLEGMMSGKTIISCSTSSRNLTAHKTFCFKNVLQCLHGASIGR